jgi:glycine/sarcosine N-methyltransferase
MDPIGAAEFYNRLAKAFDVMTDWPKRLNHEMPFLEKILRHHPVRKILDAACGTGWHSIALAKIGFTVTGCDVSPSMVELARMNAERSRVEVAFEVADFSQLERIPGKFDALLCLGNSLPHVLTRATLGQAMTQMAGKLSPLGVLILHNLNYDLRLRTKPRFFSAEGNADQIVWRFADYVPNQIVFHTALFERSHSEPPQWSVQVNSTIQYPWLAEDYDHALQEAAFQKIEHFGGLDGSPYDRDKSGDLVIAATR